MKPKQCNSITTRILNQTKTCSDFQCGAHIHKEKEKQKSITENKPEMTHNRAWNNNFSDIFIQMVHFWKSRH